MKGEWCYWRDYFTPEICNMIIEKGTELQVKDAVMGPRGEHFNDSRKSKIRFIHEYNKDFEFLFDAIWKVAIKTNARWFDFHINKLESIQLAEYDASYLGEYKEHIDTFWINPIKPGTQRKLSAIIQLTDPSEYDGGDLEITGAMEKPNSDDIRQQGTITFFPSFMPHKANPVTRGKRYSLACWFEGPSFR